MIRKKLSSAYCLALLSLGVVCHAQDEKGLEERDITRYIFRGLAISNEPSILARCDSAYEAFRVFEYAGMTPIGIIRAERENRVSRLYVRKLESGQFSEAVVTDLDGTHWAELVDAFQLSGFWSSETETGVWMPDSLSWVIEACYKEKFHLIKLYPDRDFRMNEVFEHMMALVS